MMNPKSKVSEPPSRGDAATAARRLRPTQAAPAQRDPRADGCIDERLDGGTLSAACKGGASAFSCTKGCSGTWWAL